MPTNIITSPQSYSYNGGQFTIQANKLSPSSSIIVNGFRGKITSYSSSSVTYQLPSLLTTLSQSTYKLADVSLIDLTAATFFSDTALGNVSTTFDGAVTSYYGSANANCWIGIDLGQGLEASIDRVRFFPNLNWANTASIILYA